MNIRHLLENIIKENTKMEIEILPCHDYKFGDYTTSIAFSIDKSNPNKVAKDLATKLKLPKELIERVEIKDGYINLFLQKDFVQKFALEILKEGDKFGSSDIGKDKKILVEFVSANPTGPLNIANGRAAAFGDSLVRILNFNGYHAESEYYIDDCGRQVDLLEESVKARYYEKEPPENGYMGEYVKEIAKNIKNLDNVRNFCVSYIVEWQKATLNKMGVNFDNWIYESDMRKSELMTKVIQKINNNNGLYKKDGAIWLKMKTKDKVLIKRDGSPAYILPDIVYHINKFDRGYDMLIDIFGPDHISHIEELKTALSYCDMPLDKLKFIIVQWTSFIREGKKISMSKRAGEFITLDELIDEVGKDAARFFFLSRRCESHLDFDIDLAKKQSEENPVYYVQYAHARICSILKLAQFKKIEFDDANLSLINTDEEFLLIKKLIHFPEIVEEATNKFSPHIIPFYLIELAKIFHKFYEKHRVISEDVELTKSRLLLIKAVKQVISNALALIGVDAPEKM